MLLGIINGMRALKLHKGHKLLMVNLNRSYMNKDKMRVVPDIYEITRGNWKVNKNNADEVDYVLGIYKGIVRCVIKPTTHFSSGSATRYVRG